MNESSPQPAAGPPGRGAGTVLHRSFPLVMLLQLATCSAAVLTCIDGPALGRVIDNPPAGTTIRVVVVVGLLLAGGVIGSFVGLGQIRKWRSAAIGFVVGAMLGAVILCVYVAPAPVERIGAAAAVIVLTTVIVRLRAA